MPGLSSLTKSLTSQISGIKSDAYLVDMTQYVSGEKGSNTRLPFQYWPETVSDTKANNYQPKEIPGGSLPLYQWINGGERLITFTAVFTTDVDLIDAEAPPGIFSFGSNNITDRIDKAGVARRNVDIRAAIAWLRQFMYPRYTDGEGSGLKLEGGLTMAPNKLLLVLPNSGIGLAGANASTTDSVYCIMTQCDVTYEQFFPNGLPRIASVQLGFAEIPQREGFIKFPARTEDMEKAVSGENRSTTGYTFTPRIRGKAVE